jgi:signal transduction histidine kinase
MSGRGEPMVLTPRWSIVIASVLTLFVGLGDHATGADVAFGLFYLIPISLGTWYAGFAAGVWICVLAGGCSLVVEITDERIRTALSISVWNELGSLAIFLGFAYLLDRQREHLAAERHQKKLIVDQLRHADRLNVIGTLAAGVAHEIGTPLNVISGSAELLPSARPGEIEELSRVIREQTSRISGIIRQLLDFGRRAGARGTSIDLNDLVRGSVVLLGPIARKHGTSIAVEAAEVPVRVLGNGGELEQVLSNLILNAVQAMPGGGVVRLAVGRVSRTNGNREQRAFGSISVEDTGTGIAAADLPRIFDPFFTTKGVGEGTGLGLSVSYGIVQDHGGLIEVDSVVGRGTRFAVLLPLAAAA